MLDRGDIYALRLHEVVLDLFTKGYTYREIALRLYDSDEEWAINRVKALLSYARKNYLYNYYDRSKEVYETLLGEGLVSAYVKHHKDKYKRQWLEHQGLIHHILVKLDIPRFDPVMSEATFLHSKVFPRVWKKYNGTEHLRVWRNSNKDIPFSFTWESLAYVYSIVNSVLLSFALYQKRRRLNDVVFSLIPKRKRRNMQRFREAHAEISGMIYDAMFGPPFF